MIFGPPSSASAAPTSMKKKFRASFDSINFFKGLPPNMRPQDDDHHRLSEQLEYEPLGLNPRSNDTTDSTIDGILAQYDARTSSLKAEYENTREYLAQADLFVSQPPRESLPELPATGIRPFSDVRESEYDSPVPESSITDSQYLLDAEAQAHELEKARRALVPLPLNIVQSRSSMEIPRDVPSDIRDNVDALIPRYGATWNQSSLARPEIRTYRNPMERDISRRLRHLSGDAGYSAGTSYDSDIDDDASFRRAGPQGKIFEPSSLPTARNGKKPIRQIKVVIGRESETDKNNQSHNDAQAEVQHERRDVFSEDGDWVTEATSEVGFGFCNDVVTGRPLTGGLKRAGSSLADYSDDGNEGTVDRFGSCERILQYQTGVELYSDVQRSKESKFSALLPRRYNAFPESTNHRWESTAQQGPAQFRPQVLRRNTNLYRDGGVGRQGATRRLVFDFDQNAPPKYEFRDSVSEYEPAGASTKANCGTHQYDTQGSLPSPVSEIGEDNRNSISSSYLDQSIELNGDRISPNTSRKRKTYATIHRSRDMKFSIYAADRRRQLQELNKREFAAGSSYYDPPSISSVRSKFNFELLPLDLAQQKNKIQRDSGETNETESAAARLKRKKSAPSIERPPKAFFTGRDLSVDFSPPAWQSRKLNPQASPDTPTPLGYPNEVSPRMNGKYWKKNSLGSPNTVSSFGTPSIMGRVLDCQSVRRLAPARRRHYHGPRWGLVAPDDYVSDRADGIRRFFFCLLAVLSILPFVGVLALSGAFSEAFKWATQGEVDRLTARQRRFIKWMLFVECVVYSGTVVAVVIYFVLKSKAQS
ncbi:hypothetical protein NUW58_g3849 [Xylaria curta]|uniref:Uncharacterized protein n=1 Tax=Xylaria curta TaxID=42375 RepID=A0ACC1PAC2_9PEZI|nr:hypothetical protein NUW58_g3849 [Xylaria curta]